MKTTHTLEQIFGTRSRVRVLRVLHEVEVPLNASQLAVRTLLSQPAVSSALAQLVSMGLVETTSAGRANIYWLVRENVYVQRLIQPAFRFELDAAEILEDDLRAMFGEPAQSIVLFGSYARGEQGSSSDVDVVVVVEGADTKQRLEAELLAGARTFARRWGCPLSVIIYDSAEAGDLGSRAPALLASLVDEGVLVSGRFPFEWARLWGSGT